MSNIYYYLVDFNAGNYNSILPGIKYLQIKGKADDAAKSIIISNEIINSIYATQCSKEEAQVILDLWIDDENLIPEKNFESKDILQEKIYLTKYENIQL